MYCQPTSCKAVGVTGPGAHVEPIVITRRACADDDVVIAIKFAGICHSDIHTIREEWGPIPYPLVVGHEIAGFVEQVGKNVTKFKVGDRVGVGCMVDSCRTCRNCSAGHQQYCHNGFVGTYASNFKFPHCAEYNEEGGAITHGGYSTHIVVNEGFVLRIPENLDMAAAAPLLCAGITTYSPLIQFNLRPSHRLAVVGLGGLGHMAAKFGHAFGAHTTVISRGTEKRETAMNELKADAYVDSTNAEQMAAVKTSFDIIINTISAKHDVEQLLGLLTYDGTMILLGAPPDKMQMKASPFIHGRRRLAGSLIGGIPETQDMLDFCGRHNITCDIEMVDASHVNEAHARTRKGDVKYRFVIDISTI